VAGAITVAVAMTGCGKGSPATLTRESATSQLIAVCSEASHELLTIDQQKLRAPELSVVGRLIEEAATEGEKVDETTAAKMHRLPTNRHTATALAYLAHSRTELQAVVRAVRRHGTEYIDLPRGLLLSFLRANSGCGQVHLRNPTTG
jgi:hypothetical protein